MTHARALWRTPWCRNCQQPHEKHLDSKCLFDSTEYVAMGEDEYALFIRQKMEEVAKQAGFTSWPAVQWSQPLPIQVFPTRPTIDVTPKFRDENNLLSYLPTTLPIV